MNDNASTPDIILAAGGTGGHIFPAESLADILLSRSEAVGLMTDRRFGDYHMVRDDSAFARIPIYTIHAGRLGRGLWGKLRGVYGILVGTIQARKLLKQIRPKAVIGFGGYPSFPTMLAASQLGIPTIIHEQNALLGRANRKLAERVNRIATSYQQTHYLPPNCQSKTVFTGNPVRAGIRALHHVPYAPPQPDGVLRLLVTGGSQGASIFADVLPKAVAQLPENLRNRLRIDQQCRENEVKAVRTAYAELGLQVDVAPFFHDMPARLASAHLVIARAGASTVSELSAAGRPAMLVPLPTAMDNHQYMNAQAIEDADAGWVVAQNAFTVEAVSSRLESFLTLPNMLQQAAQQMRELGTISAADDLADLVHAVMVGRQRKQYLPMRKAPVADGQETASQSNSNGGQAA